MSVRARARARQLANEDRDRRHLQADLGARRRLSGRFLLVGTGLESTRATVALTQKAAELGADAALVLTPCYYKSRMTVEALRRHFETVAEAAPIPVYLYSVPAFTGLAWPPALSEALAAHPRIAGIKESSGDVALLARIVASAPPSFEVACGNGPVFYPALCVGAVGGVLAVANCAPGPTAALFRAFERGDHARARKLQAALGPLAAAVTSVHGVAGLKRAMDHVGLRGGCVRAPLQEAPAAAVAEIVALLERAERACAEAAVAP